MAGFVECLDNEDIEEAVIPMEGKCTKVVVALLLWQVYCMNDSGVLEKWVAERVWGKKVL